MSLSKEFGQVSSSTSGYHPVASRRPAYRDVRPVSYEYAQFRQMYVRVFRDKAELANDKVQRLFAKCETAFAKLQGAMSDQMAAECFYRSSLLPIFPILTAEDVDSVLDMDQANMDLSALTGETLLRSVTTPDATATTPATPAATTPATPAATTPATSTTLTARKPKITVLLPRRVPVGSGATATLTRPIKPGKRPSPKPVCLKPSKRATPSTAPTTAEDDLPASASTSI